MSSFTQTAILNTFGEMLERMPFDKITVSALIRECNISRNTFYYHYSDIYALLDTWLLQELGKFESLSDPENWQENTKSFLYACRAQKKRVYHIFDSISRDRIERYIFSSSDNVFYTYVRRMASGRDIPEQRIRALSDICCYAFVGYFLRFLWNGMTDDIEAAVNDLGVLFDEIVQNTLDCSV